jgi:hypothetical protein
MDRTANKVVILAQPISHILLCGVQWRVAFRGTLPTGHSQGGAIAGLAAWKFQQIDQIRFRLVGAWVIAGVWSRPGADPTSLYDVAPLGAWDMATIGTNV